jgi:hypothetical protein
VAIAVRKATSIEEVSPKRTPAVWIATSDGTVLVMTVLR